MKQIQHQPEKTTKQLPIPAYHGYKIESRGDTLKITIRWFRAKSRWRLVVPGALLLCSGGMVFGYILDSGWGMILLLLMSLGVAVTLYETLTDLLNSTTIMVTPAMLEVKHGPLPVPLQQKRKQFAVNQISQLYVAETKLANGLTLYNDYQLYAIVNNKHEGLLAGDAFVSKWERILYLEQEIERHLALTDYPVPEESQAQSSALNKTREVVWQALSAANQLTYTPRASLKGAYISGHYQGHYLELDTFSQKEDKAIIHTRLILAAAGVGTGIPAVSPDDEPLEIAQLNKLFSPGDWPCPLKGTATLDTGGQKLLYQQTGIETRANYLQFLFEHFSDMLINYPKLLVLGGEAIPHLRPVMAAKKHPLRRVAAQVIKDIARETTRRLGNKTARLICSRCLGRCTDQHPDLLPNVTYYACHACAQSQHFFEIEGRIVAVLDTGMAARQIRQNDDLRLNWLAWRTPFDFDTVEIINATDEDVERFAVQVGNDIDPLRRSRYKKIHCVVSPVCALSENILRILQYTFGQVETQS